MPSGWDLLLVTYYSTNKQAEAKTDQ